MVQNLVLDPDEYQKEPTVCSNKLECLKVIVKDKKVNIAVTYYRSTSITKIRLGRRCLSMSITLAYLAKV
jgi:hypothetical protein